MPNIPIRLAGLGLSSSSKVLELRQATIAYYGRPVPGRDHLLVDGVFEGGGALGSAYIGALRALQEQKIWFQRVSGASAGAITAALIAGGFTAPEIEWLCSCYLSDRELERSRPASLPRNLFPKPINFLDFLDGPANANAFSQDLRRNTFLWKALKGSAIDQLLNTKLTGFLTRDEIIAKMRRDWPTVDNPILNVAIPLIPLKEPGLALFRIMLESIGVPNTEPYLKDFLLFDTEPQRIAFADAVWKIILDNSKEVRWITNLIYNGYIFKGDVFLSTMKQLLGAKKFPQDPTRIVKFSDLPIPLTVIASDTNSASMKIYGSGLPDSNNMEVAEAVRQSMSIPFVFAPRLNNRFMDGGMCSNYPYWLYSPAGSDFVVKRNGDDHKIKLGFILDDDNYLNPADFGCFPAKWHRERAPFAPYEPPIADVLKENFGAGREQPDPAADAALEAELSRFKFLDIMDRQQKTMDKREWHLHEKLSATLMAGLKFYEIKIPVKGYHWLDFKVNTTEDDFTSIADRGYMSTMKTLIDKAVILSPAGRDWKMSGPYH